RSSVHLVAPEFTALKSHCDRSYLRNLRTDKKANDDASVNHDRNAPAGTGGAPAFCSAGGGALAASAGNPVHTPFGQGKHIQTANQCFS
ncbi:hypothetical protein ACTLM6_004747, partial [Escherichia coli]